MDPATLLIACYGAVVSTGVAGWNVWRELVRTRSRLAIDLSYCKYPRLLANLDDVQTVIAFRVVNIGHIPVYVEGIGCTMRISEAYKARNELSSLKEKRAEWTLRACELYDSVGNEDIFPKELKPAEPMEGELNSLAFLEDNDEHALRNLWIKDSTGRRFYFSSKAVARLKMWHKRNPPLTQDLSIRNMRWR
jgi:hypothetical protein